MEKYQVVCARPATEDEEIIELLCEISVVSKRIAKNLTLLAEQTDARKKNRESWNVEEFDFLN